MSEMVMLVITVPVVIFNTSFLRVPISCTASSAFSMVVIFTFYFIMYNGRKTILFFHVRMWIWRRSAITKYFAHFRARGTKWKRFSVFYSVLGRLPADLKNTAKHAPSVQFMLMVFSFYDHVKCLQNKVGQISLLCQ